MTTVFIDEDMLCLWELAGRIGAKGESDPRYESIYRGLSDAIDAAEEQELIVYEEDQDTKKPQGWR